MATQHQKKTALRTGIVPTGADMARTPKERVNHAGIYLSSRDTNKARLKYETETGMIGVRGSYETTANYSIFNVDGEIYLRPEGPDLPAAYGRHDAETHVGYRDQNKANPDLRAKADKLAKELQGIVDEAGRGRTPTEKDVRLRELLEDREKFKYGGMLYGLDRIKRLHSPLQGLKQEAMETAEHLEKLTIQIRQQIKKEIEELKEGE